MLSGPDGAVAMPSGNGVVGIGLASRYLLQRKTGFYKHSERV